MAALVAPIAVTLFSAGIVSQPVLRASVSTFENFATPLHDGRLLHINLFVRLHLRARGVRQVTSAEFGGEKNMRSKVTKAIFPVAGLGTRFLPATKSIPKEIMTLVDRPLIQYAIDEARAAGITEFIFVTSRGKGALEDYFDSAPVLEDSLRESGKTDILDDLQNTNMESGAIAYIRQHKALGLGHAVWCARRLIADEPFAVILPDDVIAGDKPCLQQMVEAYEDNSGCMVATMEVPKERTRDYGILDVAESEGRLFNVRGMI